MTRRPNDPTKEPPGGRALERLRQFEDARKPSGTPEESSRKTPRGRKETPKATNEEDADEDRDP